MVAPEELVVLLDDDRQPAGTMPKSQVHTADTPLHLALSVYVFDDAGRLLVTRRALTKPTWGGVWTNSCCGHPGPGEDIAQAARRRLQQELGLTATTMDMVLPDFAYRATSAEGVVENEVCPVFVARVSGNPTPDPTEVTEWQWVDWPVFRLLAVTAPWALSPWAVAQVSELPDRLP